MLQAVNYRDAILGQLPDQIIYGLTHGVAVDKAGNVYVLHTSRKNSPSKDTVVVFDKDGNYVRSWGEQFFGTAHGFDLIVEDGREIFYITDMAHKPEMDAVWCAWVARDGWPQRACIAVKLADRDLVEIVVTAAA